MILPSSQASIPPGDNGEVGAGAPEPLKCRVNELLRGVRGGWCQVKPMPNCPFGLPFRQGLICQHPRCDLIVEQTRNKIAASTSK